MEKIKNPGDLENNLNIKSSEEKSNQTIGTENVHVGADKKLEKIERRKREIKEINEIRAKLGIPELGEPFFSDGSADRAYAAHMREVAGKVQAMFIGAAEKFLPKDSLIKKQIIKSYSNREQLVNELTNVFRRVESEDIDNRVKELEEKLKDEVFFAKEVLSKDFSTSD